MYLTSLNLDLLHMRGFAIKDVRLIKNGVTPAV